MGQSPSAHLYYGVRIPGYDSYLQEGEEGYEAQEWRNRVSDDEGDDFETYLAKLLGLKDPWDEVRGMEDADYQAYRKANPDFAARTTAWYFAKRKALEACPIAFGSYGSYEFGGHILHLAGVSASATHWEEEVIDLDAMLSKVTPEAIAAARFFCNTHGLPAFDNPQWWLCPSFG